MAGRIEAALNQGKNGYNLYQHIYSCNPQNYNETPPDQYLQGDREKMVLYHFVDKLTGLDLRKLENRDGKYYTPDGEELWSALEKKYADLVAENKADAFGLGEYKAAYDRIAKMDGIRARTVICHLTIKTDIYVTLIWNMGTVRDRPNGRTEYENGMMV